MQGNRLLRIPRFLHIACNEIETRSDHFLLFGYFIEGIYPVIDETGATINYNYSFDFHKDCKKIYAQFLTEFKLKKRSEKKPKVSDEEREKILENFTNEMKFGVFGSVTRH